MNIDSSGIADIMRKIKKKDPALFNSVKKKIVQISLMDSSALQHFKNLRHDLSHLKRVQIGSYVLTFRINDNTLIFEDLNHHDKIYDKWR